MCCPLQSTVSGVSTGDGRWTPADGFTDIRCDEDYEAFYQAQLEAGRNKLPPPLDNRTLYETLPSNVQHGLTKHQQRWLAARMTPSPNGALSLSVRIHVDIRQPATGPTAILSCITGAHA